MLKDSLKNFEIVLASGSPRRHQFFEELGIPVKIDVRPVEEVYPEELKASEITDYLAKLKAESFKDDIKENQVVITSDTIVYNNDIALGKPSDYKEAVEMISSLSGKEHDVITSVCFTTAENQKVLNHITKVFFRELEKEEIEFYVKNYEPYDKAGAYAIQEWIGLIGIEKIEGSYFNVVGLPTHLVYKTLKELIDS